MRFHLLRLLFAALTSVAALSTSRAQSAPVAVEVSSLAELARVAAASGQQVKLAPGVYRMADYLTEDVLREIRAGVDRTQRRPPVPMFVFRGSDNTFDLRDVVLEIDTTLYPKLPQGGYTRCLIMAGHRNRLTGLTIRNTGPNQGSGGNLLSVAGEGNILEDVTLYVHGSSPFGYGDLLGKGGPNLVAIQKQSGIQLLGSRTLLRRCKVLSRALGHCFYIQGGEGSRLEDCYAEGVMRATNDMLRDTSGPAFALGFRSVYVNRDGRFVITPGYVKSLVEDGFRTYGGAGSVTLVNCVARHTRAGFEISAPDASATKTVIESCTALGCERGYLLGSQVIVRRSRGDIAHGPLLYLRGGRDSDVELELTGEGGASTVHALATIAGTRHRVRLTGRDYDAGAPALPIMLGFAMPEHGEMASPILPAPAEEIQMSSELVRFPVIRSEAVKGGSVQAAGPVHEDAALHRVGPVSGSGAWPAGPA